MKHICVTRSGKREQVATKYTISQNCTYLKFCVQYLLSANIKMLLIKLFIDGKTFTSMVSADHSFMMPQI